MSTDKADPVLPDIPKGFDLPFYYGAFTNLGIDYLVPKDKAEDLLKKCTAHEALSVAAFDGGQACLSFNFQVYFGQFSDGGAVIQEIEFNIVSHPRAGADRVPKLSYERYARGEDQTRSLGFCRYRVACDSPLAIRAGEELFGEPKFKTGFDTAIPVPNGTPVQGPAQPQGGGTTWYDTWTVACLKEKEGQPLVTEEDRERAERHFTFTADLRNVPARPVSAAPFTEYGSRGKDASAKALAAPLNVFHPYQWYDLKRAKKQPDTEKRVTLTLGSTADPRITEFVDVIKSLDPVGAWLFQSPPVAVQNRPYYVPVSGHGSGHA